MHAEDLRLSRQSWSSGGLGGNSCPLVGHVREPDIICGLMSLQNIYSSDFYPNSTCLTFLAFIIRTDLLSWNQADDTEIFKDKSWKPFPLTSGSSSDCVLGEVLSLPVPALMDLSLPQSLSSLISHLPQFFKGLCGLLSYLLNRSLGLRRSSLRVRPSQGGKHHCAGPQLAQN